MKQLILTMAVLLISAICCAQSPIPEFGKIEKSDLEINSCDFDKNAEALVLFDEGEFFCNIVPASLNPVQIQNERHVRIKILNNKGLKHANVHVKYYSYQGEEDVKDIAAQTYNLDESGHIVTSKLEKKLIYRKELNKRYSEVVFTLPDVKAGSVIEYKYTIDGSSDGKWYFQQNIPVKLSRYAINFPSEFEMSSVPHCMLPYQQKTERRSGRDMQVYYMENVPALRDEAFISSPEDYLQSIEARLIALNLPGMPRKSLVRSWPGLIKQIMEDEDFGIQLKKNIPRTSDLDSMLKKLTSPYDKMTTIHHYVRKNMEWNGYDNIWALSGVKSAWKDKKGTSGEINLILVNLLRDAGLKAHPVLVSTKDHGRINPFYPTFYQFNKVMAYVEIDDNVYVLDAVEKYTPSNIVPLEVALTEGLVIEKIDTYEWGWKTLWNNAGDYRQSVIINAEIDKDGVMHGSSMLSSEGYDRIIKMPSLKEGKKDFIKQHLTVEGSGINIDSVALENEKADSLPLNQTVTFTKELNGTGEYKYFNINIFSGLEKNPFVEDTRFSDIFFGYRQHYAIVGNITAPENYVFDELPKNTRMMMPDTSISFLRLSGVTDNMLSFRINLDFKKPFFAVAEYDEFKEFYKKLFDLLNEQFVIRKKN